VRGDVELAEVLLAHFEEVRSARALPWHADPASARDALLGVLVEGLLVRTRAESVAASLEEVFTGVELPGDWSSLRPAERYRRVAPLGLPDAKVKAVNRLDLWESTGRPDALLDPRRYVDAVAMLRAGTTEGLAPVDSNVDRVARRFSLRLGPATLSAAAVRGASAASGGGALPAAYRAVMGLVGLGATHCVPRSPRCERCPLSGRCAMAGQRRERG